MRSASGTGSRIREASVDQRRAFAAIAPLVLTAIGHCLTVRHVGEVVVIADVVVHPSRGADAVDLSPDEGRAFRTEAPRVLAAREVRAVVIDEVVAAADVPRLKSGVGSTIGMRMGR